MNSVEMRELGVLPIYFYGNTRIESLQCGFHDARKDQCENQGYSTIYLPELGYTLIACQHHWDDFWRSYVRKTSQGERQ